MSLRDFLNIFYNSREIFINLADNSGYWNLKTQNTTNYYEIY